MDAPEHGTGFRTKLDDSCIRQRFGTDGAGLPWIHDVAGDMAETE